MRALLVCGCAAAAFMAAACSDLPSAPEQGIQIVPISSFAHWTVPGRCYSATQLAVAPHQEEDNPDILTTDAELAAAYAADGNGNGWVCLNQEQVSFGVYELPAAGERTDFDDDFATCTEDGYTTEFRGSDPADEDGDGFVCVSGDGDVMDDGGDAEAGQVGGGDLGGDIVCDAGTATPVAELDDQEEKDKDENGNGYVCVDEGVDILGGGAYRDVEDDLADPVGPVGMTLTAGKINGHGTWQLAGRTLSFSFHAKSDGESVKGGFEFHDRTSDIRVHGDVTCVEVDGGTALLEGVVTNNKEGGPAEGTALAWTAVDNGEGKKADADELAEPEAFGELTEACSARPTRLSSPIAGGNIQVR